MDNLSTVIFIIIIVIFLIMGVVQLIQKAFRPTSSGDFYRGKEIETDTIIDDLDEASAKAKALRKKQRELLEQRKDALRAAGK